MFMKKNNNCSLYCSCGCNNGVLLKAEKDEDFGYEISLVSDIYYSKTAPLWTRFKEKCCRIWYIIRNKEHCYFNIFVEKEELEEFKEFVSNLSYAEEYNG